MDQTDRLAEIKEPIGWYCGCGHPNGLNLSACACCSRVPGGPDNIIEVFYRQPGCCCAALKAAEAEIVSLREALTELRIDANRLCDRRLGGTYEDDCRRSIRKADGALGVKP